MGRPATLRVDIATTADSRGVDAAEKRFGRFGGAVKKTAKVAGVGLAAVGVAAVAGAKQAVDAASRQQQAYGALSSIYGKSAKQVKAWGRAAADAVGLSRAEYAELSSVVGAQLTNMGFAQDQAAHKSRGLIKTGADLAATFGGTVSDAVSAVSSLLKGESDPIERYGVSIKAADVSARLAAKGLDGLTGKALRQAQAQEVLSMLNEQTASSAGAFARESNTLAGQQERLRAKFENVKATVGTALLPILTALFSFIGNRLIPWVSRAGREFGDRFGPTLTRVGQWIQTRLVPALRQLVGWFVEHVIPAVQRVAGPVLSGIRAAFGYVAAAINRNREPLMTLVRFLGRTWEAAEPVRRIMAGSLGLAFRTVGRFIAGAVDVVGALISGLSRLGAYLDWIRDKLAAIASAPLGVLKKLGGLFDGSTPLHRMTPRLSSWAPTATPLGGGLATAAAAGGGLLGLLDSVSPAGGTTYVDARSFPVTLTVEGGALTDPAIVDRIQRALDTRQRQLGRRPAFGA